MSQAHADLELQETADRHGLLIVHEHDGYSHQLSTDALLSLPED